MKSKMFRQQACATLFTLAVGLPLAAPAQTTSTSGATAAEDTDVISLTPFEVDASKDVGYTAVDSLAGGRQNTPVRVTPASVSSLTSTFLDDLSLTNLQDALKWGLNAIPTNFRGGMNGGSGGEVFNYWSVSIRGDSKVQGGNPPTKNYFPTFMAIDTYNVDRIEIDGGPNSILFGIGDIGGSLTAYTKNAQIGNAITEATVRLSSYGGYRFTTDINRAVTDNWAIRLNAVVADEKGWKDGDFRKKLGADLATIYKFSDNTQVRFQVEGWKEKKAIFASTIRDGYSLWDGSTNAATWRQEIAGINDN
ncbi:MAG: TonB-dependent receptor plug domain-containing protein, partial [Opitutaceae bacterium]